MPRDGSGQFYLQPGTEAVTGETIRSDQFNQRFEDVKNDLNAARPVAVGGTGATDATSARANLGAASQAALTALEGRVTPINRGGTGAATAAAARTSLGVPHVDGAATITGPWTYLQAAVQGFPSDGAGIVITHRWNIGADWTWTLRHWPNGDLEFNRHVGGGVFKVSGAEVWTAANLTPTPAGIGAVPTARTVTAGDGLTGGGNLTANRSLAVDGTVARRNANNTFNGTAAFVDSVGVFISSGGGNAHYWMRDQGGDPIGLMYASDASRTVSLRSYASNGTSKEATLASDGTLSAPSFSGNGAALTNLPVAAETAALPVGAVGTYAMLRYQGSTSPLSPGTIINGTDLRFASAGGAFSSTVPSGQWELHGLVTTENGAQRTSLWLRKS